MKFVLMVEGETEDQNVAEFLKKGIDPYFERAVGIKTVRFSGWKDLYKDAPSRAAAYLTDPGKDDIVAVLSLLDLYGPEIYPADLTSARERHQWGVRHMHERFEKHLSDKRIDAALTEKYRHFFAVHETEAWLIASPQHHPQEIKRSLESLGKPPEHVNFKQPPAKLLDYLHQKHYGRKYKKTTQGRNLFQKNNAPEVARFCPFLNAMLIDMRRLVVQAGIANIHDVEQPLPEDVK